MLLPQDTQIAGTKTVKDWIDLKAKLSISKVPNLWLVAFNDFFRARLDYRYLKPIESIKRSDTYSGEGFSIMAIICSLIEFLEATYQGKSYRYLRQGKTLGPHEYNKSSEIFISFLVNRHPFCNHFTQTIATDFYEKIRCGLLHEARTRGKWIIRFTSGKKVIFEVKTNETVLYRDDFLEAINEYINYYKNELLKVEKIQKAFIRKFDSLCEE